MAWRNLSRQRLRAGLAALGILIGVFAVGSLGSLGTALQLAATDELGGLGTQVIISPNEEAGVDTLNDRDIREIERIAQGRGEAIPLKATGGIVQRGERRTVAQVYGTRQPGRLFDSRDGELPTYHRQGAIVGSDIARELGLQVGSTVTVESNSYRVVAILEEQASVSPVRADSAVILPPDEFRQEGFSQVVVVADSTADARSVASETRARLNAREQRVSVLSLTTVLARIGEFFALLNGFLLAIAAVSLVVAGISIFNVMLMSTAERRQEIGVLRAVGVQRSDVLRTLLVEAGLLGLGGGAAGAVTAGIAVTGVAAVTRLSYDVVFVPRNGAILFGAFVFGVVIALVSGFYPAYRAATDSPVDALRG